MFTGRCKSSCKISEFPLAQAETNALCLQAEASTILDTFGSQSKYLTMEGLFNLQAVLKAMFWAKSCKFFAQFFFFKKKKSKLFVYQC